MLDCHDLTLQHVQYFYNENLDVTVELDNLYPEVCELSERETRKEIYLLVSLNRVYVEGT